MRNCFLLSCFFFLHLWTHSSYSLAYFSTLTISGRLKTIHIHPHSMKEVKGWAGDVHHECTAPPPPLVSEHPSFSFPFMWRWNIKAAGDFSVRPHGGEWSLAWCITLLIIISSQYYLFLVELKKKTLASVAHVYILLNLPCLFKLAVNFGAGLTGLD